MPLAGGLGFQFTLFQQGGQSMPTALLLDASGAPPARRARPSQVSKAPIMTACRRRLLFFKIEVRPWPCRPYRVQRPCIVVYLLSKFGSESGISILMQILDLIGMHFDAVVVEFEKYLLFSDWLWPYRGFLNIK